MALTDGRSFELSAPSGETEVVTLEAGWMDGGTHPFLDAIRSHCASANGTRFAGLPIATERLRFPLRAEATALAEHLCAGHLYMSLATSLAPVDVVSTSTGYDIVPRASLEAPPPEGNLLYTLPPPSNESAGTLAAMAVAENTEAALAAARILDPARCEDGVLGATIPGGSPQGGFTGDSPVTLASWVSTVGGEAVLNLMDSAELAQERFQATAYAMTSQDHDRLRAHRRSWTDALHGRAATLVLQAGMARPGGLTTTCTPPPEGMNVYFPSDPMVPRCWIEEGGYCRWADCPDNVCIDEAVFEDPSMGSTAPGFACPPPPSSHEIPGGGDSVPLDLPTCTPLTSETAENALGALRATGVEPRQAVPAIMADLQAAYAQEYPSVADEIMALTPEEFVRETLRADPRAVARAANRLVEEADVLGRPIVPATTASTSGPARVRGTSVARLAPSPSYTFARTAGRQPIDDSASLADPEPYARRGVLNALDHVLSHFTRALTRADVQADGPADREGSARFNLGVVNRLMRARVPMRARVRVGAPRSGGVIDAVAIGLERNTRPLSEYVVVVGAVGLQCAETGTVEGEPCELAEHRVPTTLVDGELRATTGPREAPLRSDEPLFVIEPRGSTGVAILGFTPAPGPNAAEWSRTTLMPAGEVTMEQATAAVAPDPTSCDQPRECCDGVACIERIPLENEVNQNYDGDEDSALYYLARFVEAAREADALGQQVISEGLGIDVRAESAAAALETLCGGVVNTSALFPLACTSDDDCSSDENEVYGTCDESTGTCDLSLLEQLQLDPLADVSALQTCLGGGAAGELRSIAVGDRTLCYYRPVLAGGGLGDPCQWEPGMDETEDDRPACPVVVTSAASCMGGCGVFPDSIENGDYECEVAEPVGISVTEAQGLQASEPGLIARLRGGQATAEEVVAQPFLSMAAFRQLGDALGYRPSMYFFSQVTRGGTPWLVTGTESDGPAEPTQFPCRPIRDDLDCDPANYPGDELPLACGIDCSNRYQREAWSIRMSRATRMIAFLGGGSGEGIEELAFRPAMDDTPLHAWPSMWPQAAGQCVNRDWGHSTTFEHGGQFLPLNCVDGECGWACRGGLDFTQLANETIVQSVIPEWLRDHPAISAMPEEPSLIAVTHGAQTVWGRCLYSDGFIDPDFAALAGGAACPTVVYNRAVDIAGTPRTNDDVLAQFWAGRTLGGGGDETIGMFLSYVDGPFFSPWTVDGVGRPDPLELEETGPMRAGIMLDALELAELSFAEGSVGCDALLEEGPVLNSVDDLRRVSALLRCAADGMEFRVERAFLPDVPAALAASFAEDDDALIYGEFEGQSAQAAVEFQSGVQELRLSAAQTVASLRQFASAVDSARHELTILDASSDIDAFQFGMTTANQIAACGNAAAEVWKFEPGSRGVAIAQATITCINSATQIALAERIWNSQGEITDAQVAQVYSQTSSEFGEQMDRIYQATHTFASAYARVQGSLSALQSTRNQAERQLATALFADTDASGREYFVNRAMRASYDLTRIRYQRAHRDAVRMGQLARIAIEQKLGVRLEDIEHDLALVDAPAGWANNLCSMRGIDYREVREGEVDGQALADRSLADYARNLQRVVDSYAIDYPFNDGTVSHVIAFRDVVHGTTEACDVPGPNLLLHSVDPSAGGWQRVCEPGGDCLGLEGLGASAFGDPLHPRSPAAVRLSRLVVPPELADPAAAAPLVAQTVELAAGSYVLSWAERLATPDAAGQCPVVALPSARHVVPTVISQSTGELALVHDGPLYDAGASEPELGTCWRRTSVAFQIAAPARVEIGLAPLGDEAVLAAPMLERVYPAMAGDLGSTPPSLFFPTDEDLAFPIGTCPDRDGDTWRATQWTSDCEDLNDPTTCSYCTSFHVSPEAVDEGTLLGNGRVFEPNAYNFRIGRIGVNLVGTGLIDCTSSSAPAVCHATGYVPVSITHSGAFVVRNHSGEQYDAPLFPARMESARALAAERYLTNPLSSADTALMSTHLRGDFAGRPFTGDWEICLRHIDGFRFDRLEEMQLLLSEARYWTRAN